MKLKYTVLIPAAGSGERMGTDIQKQFLTILGQPLLAHTVQAFKNLQAERIVVVLPMDKLEEGRMVLNGSADIVAGGSTRHRSILAGLEALADSGTSLVVIHDGVRPVVPPNVLHSVISAAQQHGAAGPAKPLVSTVLRPDSGGMLTSAPLARSDLRASEMPQAFLFPAILEAYRQCPQEELEHGTECLYIARRHPKLQVKILDFPREQLWKVTHPGDLELAERALQAQRPFSLQVEAGVGSNLHCSLRSALQDTFPEGPSPEISVRMGTQLTELVHHWTPPSSPVFLQPCFVALGCSPVDPALLLAALPPNLLVAACVVVPPGVLSDSQCQAISAVVLDLLLHPTRGPQRRVIWC